ncbi:hypothetical protein [Salinibacter sp.]|nr:hypothetical protein [Salinibacter sp.]
MAHLHALIVEGGGDAKSRRFSSAGGHAMMQDVLGGYEHHEHFRNVVS